MSTADPGLKQVSAGPGYTLASALFLGGSEVFCVVAFTPEHTLGVTFPWVKLGSSLCE